MFYLISSFCFTSARQKRRKRAKYLNAASLMQRNASRPAHPRTSPSLDDSISSASSTLNLRHPVPSYGGAMTYYPPQADQGDGSPSRTGGPMMPSRSYGNGFQTTSNQVRTSDIQKESNYKTWSTSNVHLSRISFRNIGIRFLG